MTSTVYNSKTSTTLASLGVAIIEAKLNRLKGVSHAAQPVVVNVANVLKVKSYRSRGIDLMMHVRRSKTDTVNDVVSIGVDTSDRISAGSETIIFETITNDAKKIRVASDFMKSDARMWYYLSISTATLYQFPMTQLRDWFKNETRFNHSWFEPRNCDLEDLRRSDSRWLVTGQYQDFDTICRSWGVELVLQDVLTAMHAAVGKAVQPVDVLEDLVKVSHRQGVLLQVWDKLHPESKVRALAIVEKNNITFDVPDPVVASDITSLTIL